MHLLWAFGEDHQGSSRPPRGQRQRAGSNVASPSFVSSPSTSPDEPTFGIFISFLHGDSAQLRTPVIVCATMAL
jgi:hypothetical protein